MLSVPALLPLLSMFLLRLMVPQTAACADGYTRIDGVATAADGDVDGAERRRCMVRGELRLSILSVSAVRSLGEPGGCWCATNWVYATVVMHSRLCDMML